VEIAMRIVSRLMACPLALVCCAVAAVAKNGETVLLKGYAFRIPPRPDGPITLRHIMTHTAGFEEQVKSLILDDPRQLSPLEAYVEHAIPERIFKAGTTPAYSNYATAPWTARLWTTLLGLSALILLWTAWAHHLMSFRATY
jgi:Beta-lactamase